MRWHLSQFMKAEPHRWIISAGSTLIAIHWGLKLTHSPLPAHVHVCILVYVCICPCMNALCGGQDSAQCLPLLVSIFYCVHVWEVGTHVMFCACGGQRKTHLNQFSLSTSWVSGICEAWQSSPFIFETRFSLNLELSVFARLPSQWAPDPKLGSSCLISSSSSLGLWMCASMSRVLM